MEKKTGKTYTRKEYSEDEKSIVAFTVHYKDGSKEKLKAMTDDATMFCALLLVAAEEGIFVRGHGSDRGIGALIDLFFSEHNEVMMAAAQTRIDRIKSRLGVSDDEKEGKPH